MNYIFSMAFMANSFSMTGLLIMISLSGDSILAADIGIVQAATLALFYAFSGNARNLILNQQSSISAQSVLTNRLFLLIPLALAAYWLSIAMANAPVSIAIALILRRSVEWFDEVYLSEVERLGVKKSALLYIILQTILLVMAILWLILKLPFPLLGLWLWALLPLCLSVRFLRKNIPTLSMLLKQGISKKILPHIGSSMIIGVTVYIFRLLIIMLTGKATAGDLFTAFAIGGVMGSVFANAIGPSLAMYQKHTIGYQIPRLIKNALIAFLGVGLLLTALSLLKFNVLAISGKSFLFWQSTGLSMIAATIMVFAQMIKHRLLQHHDEHDLFGPDVMMNILLIAAVPFGYYLFGMQMLSTLYLLSAILAYVFYASYEVGEGIKSSITPVKLRYIKVAIAAMLLTPLFFQMNGGVFNDSAITFNAHGSLASLPIPISVLGCFLGVLILGNYQQARLSFTFIFTTFMLMVFATIITTGHQEKLEQAKFILLIQFILPMFGLVLGQFFHTSATDNSTLLERAFLVLLMIFVPLQLICTWLQNLYFLTPYLYYISIYQHLKYVPAIFVSAYLLVLVGLWGMQKYRVYLIILMLLMSIYVVASLSMLAMIMFYTGITIFAFYQYKQDKNKRLLIFLSVALLVSIVYLFCFVKPYMAEKVLILDATSESNYVPANLSQRMEIWKYYISGITKDSQHFIFGNPERPNRNLYPSAHNYYLDFIYNFGVIAIVPMLLLFFYAIKSVFYTLGGLTQADKQLKLQVAGLVIVLFFLIALDNCLNVGLRQPYSGIFIFFLFGLLLNRCSYFPTKAVNAT